jgi:hypothetical protein
MVRAAAIPRRVGLIAQQVRDIREQLVVPRHVFVRAGIGSLGPGGRGVAVPDHVELHAHQFAPVHELPVRVHPDGAAGDGVAAIFAAEHPFLAAVVEVVPACTLAGLPGGTPSVPALNRSGE